MTRLSALLIALATLAGLLHVSPAQAQAYPSRTIRIIAPFPPGATLDLLSRLIAQKLAEDWGVPVIVENRAGGGGIIGTDAAAKAAPDGYTFATVPNSFAANPFLRKDLPYDTQRDLAPVSLLGITPHILVVHPGVKANTIQELVALAKQQPGRLTYASFGSGSSPHLAGEMLKMQAGVDLVHVIYRGQVAALTDLLNGQVTMTFGNLPDVMGHVKAGKLRAVGIATTARSAMAPDLPTLGEGGLPGLTSDSWYGFIVPAKTPADIVKKVEAQVAQILRRPDIRERLLGAGVDPIGSTREQFGEFLKDQGAKYEKVIRTAGIKAD